MIGPHGLVPTGDDADSCGICSGVPADPIHRIRAESQDGDAWGGDHSESDLNRDRSGRRQFQGMSPSKF